MVTLDQPLAAGDRISYTGNSASSYEICFMTDNTTYSNVEATSNHLYTIPSTSALVGKSVFYVSRAQGSNTYIQSLTITRPSDDAPTAINGINAESVKADGMLYDLTGRKVTTLKAGQLYIQNGRKFIYK